MPESRASADCALCRKLADPTGWAGDLIWEFPHSLVVLGPWQYFQGYCMLVARPHVRELFELDGPARHAFIDEIATVARALEAEFRPRKLNVEMLGNQVEHLHCHVFPRYRHDPDRLKAVWVALERAATDATERQKLETGLVGRDELRTRIQAQLLRMTS
jgi:diadenosine tetraphosphate (Ap4A) HIT family hydrolase